MVQQFHVYTWHQKFVLNSNVEICLILVTQMSPCRLTSDSLINLISVKYNFRWAVRNSWGQAKKISIFWSVWWEASHFVGQWNVCHWKIWGNWSILSAHLALHPCSSTRNVWSFSKAIYPCPSLSSRVLLKYKIKSVRRFSVRQVYIGFLGVLGWGVWGRTISSKRTVSCRKCIC